MGIIEFLKSEPFNQKFQKFRVENQMEQKRLVRNFCKLELYLARLFPGNAVPLDTGNLGRIKTGIVGRIRSALQNLTSQCEKYVLINGRDKTYL